MNLKVLLRITVLAAWCTWQSGAAADTTTGAAPLVEVDAVLAPGGLEQLGLEQLGADEASRILREKRKVLLGYVPYEGALARPVFVFNGDAPGLKYLVEFTLGRVVQTRAWGPVRLSGDWPATQPPFPLR